MDSQAVSRRSSACSDISQEDLDSYGLDEEQVKNLKRTFDQFDSNKVGALSVGTVQTILKMMGMHVSCHALQVRLFKIMFTFFVKFPFCVFFWSLLTTCDFTIFFVMKFFQHKALKVKNI